MSSVENVRTFNAPKRDPIDSGGGNDYLPPDMNARLGKLEGEISGLKHSQNIHLAALVGSFAIVLGAIGIVVALVLALSTKVDQQGDKIEKLAERQIELPGKIGAELRDITKTLAESITAAKQTPPQVILLPAPQPPTPPAPKQ
jgi:hypothetical protein